MVRLDDTEFGVVSAGAGAGVQPLQPSLTPQQWFDPGYNPDNVWLSPNQPNWLPDWQQTPENFDPGLAEPAPIEPQLPDPQLAFEEEQRRLQAEEQDNLRRQQIDAQRQADQLAAEQQRQLEEQRIATARQQQNLYASTLPDPSVSPDVPNAAKDDVAHWEGNNIIIKTPAGDIVVDPNGLVYDSKTGKWVSPNNPRDTVWNPNTKRFEYPDGVSTQDKFKEMWLQNAGYRDRQLGLPAVRTDFSPKDQEIYNKGVKAAELSSTQAKLQDVRDQETSAQNLINEMLLLEKAVSDFNSKDVMEKPSALSYLGGGGTGIGSDANMPPPVIYEDKYGDLKLISSGTPINDIISGNEIIRDASGRLGYKIDPDKWPRPLAAATNIIPSVILEGLISGNPAALPGIVAGNYSADLGSRYAGDIAGHYTDNPLIIGGAQTAAALAGGFTGYKAGGLATEAAQSVADARYATRMRGIPAGEGAITRDISEVGGLSIPRRVNAGTISDVSEVAPPTVTNQTFTTAKGSTYEVLPDGTTIRNKASRVEHPGDEGIKPQSQRTVYLKEMPDTTEDISSALKSGDFLNSPQVGTYPLEVWDDGATWHLGNKITSISSGSDAATGVVDVLLPVTRPVVNQGVAIGDGASKGAFGVVKSVAEDGLTVAVRVTNPGESGLKVNNVVRVPRTSLFEAAPNPSPVAATVSAAGEEIIQPTPATTGGVRTQSGAASTARSLTPGFVDITPSNVVEQGTRVGRILRAKPIEQLGENPGIKAILGLANDLKRQVKSVSNAFAGEVKVQFKRLGETFKGEDGNIYMKNVRPSAKELELNLQKAKAVGDEALFYSDRPNRYNRALQTRVIERPTEYALDEVQRRAVRRLQRIQLALDAERRRFGIVISKGISSEDQIYQHRVALKPSLNRQLEAMAKGAKTDEYAVSASAREPRIWEDIADAVHQGVVYADAETAFMQNFRKGLQQAADAHVKDVLLKAGIGSTKELRMNPEVVARFTKMKKLLTELSSVKGVLDDKTQEAVAAFLASEEPDFDALQNALKDVKIGANAVGKEGKNFGMTPQSVRDSIAKVKEELKTLGAEYRQEAINAKSVGSDRRFVSGEVAPGMRNVDFFADDATRLERFYGGGLLYKLPWENELRNYRFSVPPLSAAARFLTPLKSQLDVSVVGMQSFMLGVSNPTKYAKNIALGIRDAFADEPYYRWEASKAGNARYVSFVGPEGNEFVSSKLSKIPVLKQFGNFFSRFGNRMRNDAFESAVAMAKRNGYVNESELEQIGRRIDSISGISLRQPSDLEYLAFFAPGFLRSQIDNVFTAFKRGSLEGQLARQYFKNYIGLGFSGVMTAAIVQGRPLSEVLDPLDRDAWERGEIAMNPNFMTIRINGEDIKYFGQYDSLVKLMFVLSDSTYQTVVDRDPIAMLKFTGYLLNTKGSIPVKAAVEFLSGQTFSGEDPNSAVSWLERIMPISAETAFEDYRKGKSKEAIITNTVTGLLGFKGSPVTEKEALNQKIEKLGLVNFDGTKVKRLSDADLVNRSIIIDKFGRLQDVPREVKEARAISDKFKSDYNEKQKEIDARYALPGSTYPKADVARAWRIATKDARDELALKYDIKDMLQPYTGPESKDKMALAVKEYFDIRDKYQKESKSSEEKYDKIDQWMADNPEKAKYINEYFDKAIKKYDSKLVELNQRDAQRLDKAGFFDIKKETWNEIQDLIPELKKYNYYVDWKIAREEEVRKTINPSLVGQGIADDLVAKTVGDEPASRLMSSLYTQNLLKWGVDGNYKNLYIAWRWGYYDPTDQMMLYLQQLALQNGWE